LRIESRQTTLSTGLLHPFIRSRGENLTLRSRFDVRNSLVAQDRGVTTLSEDRIRALRLGASYDRLDAELGLPGVSLLSVDVSQGLNVFGARETGSATLSRATGRSQFTKGALEAQRVQALGGGFNVLAAASAQYSFSNLLSSEEFFFGGTQYGRGFDPGELSGDHGVATKLEFQWGEAGRSGAIRDYQLYVFLDRGTVWRNVPSAGDKRRATGLSTGVGVRFNVFEHISGNVELGMPISGSVRALGQDDGKAARVFFTLLGRY
ncbi:MAG: ShlB/FhaC/HecB family hemolysin secretion/activation protein, partial [Alphaproteobacteria bacterium]